MDKKTVRVTITGYVQNVGFRYWIETEAEKRELDGWVRNRKDGSVEALFHGEERHVDDMVRACRHGPENARVDKISSEPDTFKGPEGFTQTDTV